MIPVKQTNRDGRGNCMAACWASILECDIDDVPHYRAIETAGGNWMNAVNTWLSKHHNLLYQELEPEISKVVRPCGWHLMNYGTRETGHSIVGHDGTPMWDPSKSESIGRLTYPKKYMYSYGVLTELTDEQRDTWAPTWRICQCGPCIRGEP